MRDDWCERLTLQDKIVIRILANVEDFSGRHKDDVVRLAYELAEEMVKSRARGDEPQESPGRLRS